MRPRSSSVARAALAAGALLLATVVPAVSQAASPATPRPSSTSVPTPTSKGKSPGVLPQQKSDEGQPKAPQRQLSATATTTAAATTAIDPCGTSGNAISCENSKPGTPSSTWDVSGAGDSTLQGFATQISVNVGETVHFKIKSTQSAYKIEIYRLGYYQGNGARLIASFSPQAGYPQSQPACVVTSGTGLIDCGNWAESASWAVPSTAVSGLYLARIIRNDTGGDSHIPFVVRNDASHSDLLFQTSDTTWEAYNTYGGNSLYTCSVSCPSGSPVLYKGASAVSYNRPFNTRTIDGGTDWWAYAEYPAIRFLERNGYDVSYFAGVDSDRRGSLIKNHKAFLSVGHDEYWSGQQRANVEAARDAGVNLAFMSGNEVYWKTRYTSDAAGNAYRTLVCYKESHYNAVVDPADPPTWTGTWRDGRFSPPADGGRPENGLTGTMFMADPPTNFPLEITSEFSKLRFWRNTAVARLSSGQSATLSANTLGYEFDSDLDNGFRPTGLIDMSRQTKSVQNAILDPYGNSEGPGTVTHSLTLYKAPSGALVFGAGTVQWSFGLDAVHDGPTSTEDPTMQQATVNLLADMSAQPTTPIAAVTPASASTDTTAPTATISAPTGNVQAGKTVTISGSATDAGGGVPAGVEVSVDGGTTWRPATGTTSWTYSWTPTTIGTATVKARATDDSGNIQATPASLSVNVVGQTCPCTIFGSTTPSTVDFPDASAYELGLRFRASVSGAVTGVRFYKSTNNTGTHTGSLWTNAGSRLATGTFTNETTSGWQTLTFTSPVAISANTTYVVSYHTNAGHYAVDQGAFATSGVSAPPLAALQDGVDGANGVYLAGTTSGFPSSTYNSNNYWVDVVFQDGGATPTPTPTTSSPTPTPTTSSPSPSPTTTSPTPTPTTTGEVSLWPTTATPGTPSANDPQAYELGTRFRSDVDGYVTGVRFYKGAQNTGTHTGSLWSASGTRLATGTFTGETASGWQTLRFSAPVSISANTDYIISYHTNVGYEAFDADYFATSGRDTAPLHAPASTSSAPNGVFAVGGSAFPSQTYRSANYWVDVLFSTSAQDVAPPTVQSTTPANGSSGVATTVKSAAVFSEAIDPASLKMSLSGPAGTVSGAVAYDSTTRTATFSPTAALASGATYTASVQASDTAGNAMTAPTTWSFTTATAASCPCSLLGNVTPTNLSSNSSDNLELGVRFTSDVDGKVTAIRFYKATTNTGTHVGTVWSATGTKLASGTFTSETASGWQTLTLSTPVSVTAGTTYVASYYAPNGNWSWAKNYYDNGLDKPPLHAPAPNGVYGVGAGFPTQTANNTNYYVDIVFQ